MWKMRQKHELSSGYTVTLRNPEQYGWKHGDHVEIEFSDMAGRMVKVYRVIWEGGVIYLSDVAKTLKLKPGATVWLNVLREGKTVYPKTRKEE